MKRTTICALSVLAGVFLASQALAQSNIDKLRGFKVTGTSLDIPTVPQDPAYIAQLRKNLEQVKLPPGFKIDVFAIVPDARHMAVSKSIGVVFTGTRKSGGARRAGSEIPSFGRGLRRARAGLDRRRADPRRAQEPALHRR